MILYDSNAVTKYFYSNMAKNDFLESIERGETDENIFPVIKYRKPSSRWIARLSHSGDLKTTLRGKGILFQSFIIPKTNSKETIVYLGVPRRLSDTLSVLSGEQYLGKTQTKNSYLYTTCTLSVFVSASKNLPKEIQNLINIYLGQEAIFQKFDLSINARILTSDLINAIEKKYGVLNPEVKSLLLKISNKGVLGGTSDAVQEKLRQEVSQYAKKIKNETLDMFIAKETRETLMKLFSKTINVSSDIALLFGSPETFFISKGIKMASKGINIAKKTKIISELDKTKSIITSKNRILKQNIQMTKKLVHPTKHKTKLVHPIKKTIKFVNPRKK